MGTIQIKKYERTVTIGKGNEQRQKVQKTYGKIIYRGTLNLNDMAEHIMKHGSVYTEDVVIGVITKLSTSLYEELTGENDEENSGSENSGSEHGATALSEYIVYDANLTS